MKQSLKETHPVVLMSSSSLVESSKNAKLQRGIFLGTFLLTPIDLGQINNKHHKCTFCNSLITPKLYKHSNLSAKFVGDKTKKHGSFNMSLLYKTVVLMHLMAYQSIMDTCTSLHCNMHLIPSVIHSVIQISKSFTMLS